MKDILNKGISPCKDFNSFVKIMSNYLSSAQKLLERHKWISNEQQTCGIHKMWQQFVGHFNWQNTHNKSRDWRLIDTYSKKTTRQTYFVFQIERLWNELYTK